MSLLQQYLLERLFAQLYCLNKLTVFMWAYFWTFYFIPLIYLPVCSLILHYLNYCSFYMMSWNQVVSVLQLCCFPSMLSCLFFFFFAFLHKLENWLVDVHKITYCDFEWDWIESIAQIGKNWHLNKISLPSYMSMEYLFIYLVFAFFHQNF